MSIDAEMFRQGMTTEEYISQIKVNKQVFLDIYAGVETPTEDTAFFQSLDGTLNLVAFTADWCGDHLTSSPAILRLAETTDRLEARVFDSDRHKELTNSFLPEYRWNTVPVFVVFDAQMNEVCRFIETAGELVPELDAMEEAVATQHAQPQDHGKPMNEMSEQSRTAIRGSRTATRVAKAREWGAVVTHGFTNTVKEGLALSPGERPAVGGTQWSAPVEQT